MMKELRFKITLTVVASIIALCTIALNRGFLADVVWTNVALVSRYLRIHTVCRPLGWFSFIVFAGFVGLATWKIVSLVQNFWQRIRRYLSSQ